MESAGCSFCKQEEETISHLFWHCDIVQVFWAKLKTPLNESCENCFEPMFTEMLVLFGVKKNVIVQAFWAKLKTVLNESCENYF